MNFWLESYLLGNLLSVVFTAGYGWVRGLQQLRGLNIDNDKRLTYQTVSALFWGLNGLGNALIFPVNVPYTLYTKQLAWYVSCVVDLQVELENETNETPSGPPGGEPNDGDGDHEVQYQTVSVRFI